MRALLAAASVVALVFAFCDGARGMFTSATATRAGSTTYNALPAAPVYGDSRAGFVQVANEAPGSFAWPEAALLGAAGAILGFAALSARGSSGPAPAAVAEPDLEAAAAAARVALLAVGGADAKPFSRRDALAAGVAMAASLPFGANAKEEAKEEAPPEKPKPKQYGPFDAPIRKADQSAIGVSTVPLPTKGKGAPGAGLGSVKIDAAGYKKCIDGSAVIGPNGCADNFAASGRKGAGGVTATMDSTKGPSRTGGVSFFDGGETKPQSDYTEDKKYLEKKAKELSS